MKKFISIIFTLCLVVALMLTASAESTHKLTYAVGASAPTVSANTEFQINIDISENTGICWLKTKIVYDSSVLTFVGANTDTSVFKTATLTVNSSTTGTEGKVIVVMGSFEVLNANNPTIYTNTGRYVTLNFKVNSDAKVGTTSVYVITSQGDAIYRKNGENVKTYDLNLPMLDIKVSDKSHTTCTPGKPVKENEISSNCVNVGSYDEVVRCTECNKVLSSKTTVIPPNDDHTPGAAVKENEKAGDCKTAATYDSVVYCTLCSKEVSREKKSGEKGSHIAGAPEVTVTEATCQKTGSVVEVYKCSVCGTQMDKKTSELALTDHVASNPVMENVVAATCTKGGSYVSVVYCGTCNKVLSSETKKTDMIPHTPAKAVVENKKEPANCGANGSYDSVVYCSSCKKEMSRVQQSIAAPAHTPGPAATETTAQICTVCNALIAPALGHTHHWVGTWSSDNSGHWYACSGCSEKKDFVEHTYDNTCDADCNVCGFKRTPADHAYGNWVTVKEPTETVEGQRERACIICGKKITESIPTVVPETTTPPVTTAPPETTTPPETTAEPAPETSAEEVTSEQTPGTTAPESKDPEQTTEPAIEDPGCGSVVSAGIAIIAILGTAIVMKKRD